MCTKCGVNKGIVCYEFEIPCISYSWKNVMINLTRSQTERYIISVSFSKKNVWMVVELLFLLLVYLKLEVIIVSLNLSELIMRNYQANAIACIFDFFFFVSRLQLISVLWERVVSQSRFCVERLAYGTSNRYLFFLLYIIQTSAKKYLTKSPTWPRPTDLPNRAVL